MLHNIMLPGDIWVEPTLLSGSSTSVITDDIGVSPIYNEHVVSYNCDMRLYLVNTSSGILFYAKDRDIYKDMNLLMQYPAMTSLRTTFHHHTNILDPDD